MHVGPDLIITVSVILGYVQGIVEFCDYGSFIGLSDLYGHWVYLNLLYCVCDLAYINGVSLLFKNHPGVIGALH